MENQKFYCYSYQLTNFLKANNHSYINRYENKEGKTVWIFDRTEELNETLTLWNDYKEFKKARQA